MAQNLPRIELKSVYLAQILIQCLSFCNTRSLIQLDGCENGIKGSKPKNVQELWRVAKNAIENMRLSTCRAFVVSFHSRIAEVIRKRGRTS